jgi:hypothetical protein
MPERVNVATMADYMSRQLFSKFGWELHGTPNESWKCTNPDHLKEDHPTDATFVYEDPYTGNYVHLLTDVKSYSATTIKSFSLNSTIESLAVAVDCAKDNENWKDLYLKAGAPPQVEGLLFVFNHDAQYDRNFNQSISHAFESPIQIPRGVRITIIGPDDVWYLNEIIADTAVLAREGTIPLNPEDLSFYYPSISRRKIARRDRSVVATIDVLKGKYQLLTYKLPQGSGSINGMLVYYRGPGQDEREFIVLIDMLRMLGMLDSCDVIHIRCARAIPMAANNFRKALSQYSGYPEHKMPEKLRKLKYFSVSSVRPNLTEYEVALGV